MINTIQPKYSDSLHNALNYLGLHLVDGRCLNKSETGELGCLLLILADYAYLTHQADND